MSQEIAMEANWLSQLKSALSENVRPPDFRKVMDDLAVSKMNTTADRAAAGAPAADCVGVPNSVRRILQNP